MNRSERRAAKSQLRNGHISRIGAIHEAGHAVGRLLTAADMGFSLEQSVSKIEVAAGASWRSVDRSRVFHSEAICIGPAMSMEMQIEYFQAYPGQRSVSPEDFALRLSAVGTKAQRLVSARGKLLIIAMGPAAEARETGWSWADVFNDMSCLADREACRREGLVAGLDQVAFAQAMEETRIQAEAYVQMKEVWLAINAVARSVKGTLAGERVAELAQPLLASILEGHKVADFAA